MLYRCVVGDNWTLLFIYIYILKYMPMPVKEDDLWYMRHLQRKHQWTIIPPTGCGWDADVILIVQHIYYPVQITKQHNNKILWMAVWLNYSILLIHTKNHFYRILLALLEIVYPMVNCNMDYSSDYSSNCESGRRELIKSCRVI